MNEIDPSLMEKVQALAAALMHNNWRMATAESCTGGLLGGVLTALPGSSTWYEGGVVSYSNAMKTGLLQVPEAIIAEHGAVSGETVRGMAAGVCKLLGVDVGVGISGVAGPGGGSVEKPVGTVWIGACVAGVTVAESYLFRGDRAAVREQSVAMAVTMLLGLVPHIHSDQTTE